MSQALKMGTNIRKSRFCIQSAGKRETRFLKMQSGVSEKFITNIRTQK